MPISASEMNAIRDDEASFRLAAELVDRALAEAQPRQLERLYEAFCDWTWVVLTSKRGGSELRDWHGLLRTFSARLSGTDTGLAGRLRGLGDLLLRLVRFTETNPVQEVVRREHVKAILDLLRSTDGGSLPRSEIKDRLGLREANLSRVLGMMETSGLVERQRQGRTALVRLSSPRRLRSGIGEFGAMAYRFKKVVLEARPTPGHVDPHRLRFEKMHSVEHSESIAPPWKYVHRRGLGDSDWEKPALAQAEGSPHALAAA